MSVWYGAILAGIISVFIGCVVRKLSGLKHEGIIDLLIGIMVYIIFAYFHIGKEVLKIQQQLKIFF